jgi:hypothetical protein
MLGKALLIDVGRPNEPQEHLRRREENAGRAATISDRQGRRRSGKTPKPPSEEPHPKGRSATFDCVDSGEDATVATEGAASCSATTAMSGKHLPVRARVFLGVTKVPVSAAFPITRHSNVVTLPVMINGIRGTLVLDTGATYVALKNDFAQKAKVEIEQNSSVRLHTANGLTEGKRGRAKII